MHVSLARLLHLLTLLLHLDALALALLILLEFVFEDTTDLWIVIFEFCASVLKLAVNLLDSTSANCIS